MNSTSEAEPKSKGNRDTKHGRSILLQQARIRKVNRQKNNPIFVDEQRRTTQNIGLIIKLILLIIIALLIYLSLGIEGLIRWLNH